MARPNLLARLLIVLAAVSAPVFAQEVRDYQPDDAVDPHEVAEILGGAPAAGPGIKMRAIRLLPPAGAAARPSALSLPVQFAFDSARILPAARRQLDALAAGIRLLPDAKAIVIEGHTDARGEAAYNEQLSRRRAEAVKRYLISGHGLQAERLRVVGLGETQPRPGLDPNAPQNRRVQFRGE